MELVTGQCQVGSLTGAVASQRVTEAPKDTLRTGDGTVSGGQFDWGGRLPKSNGGAQRYAQIGWKSIEECKCRSVLDCESNNSNRDESRD